ncbi:MAG: hypothetical protein ACI9KE_003342 [Polyangiales bacterium]|jgi:hypothetical protein
MGLEPKALHRGEEAWELVVEKLVRVGPNYYKPRRQCVRGRDDILQTLDRLNRPALLEDAKRAMEGPSQAYQVTQGRLEAFEGERESPSGTNDEIRRLARRCARLESRLEALEGALRPSKAQKQRPRPSSPVVEPRTQGVSESPTAESHERRSGTPAIRPAAPSSRPQKSDEDPREPEDIASDARPAPPESEAADAATDATSETPASDAAAPARLTFPERAALETAYTELIGAEMVMEEIPPFALDEGTFYMTDLLDDSDEVVGALVLDLRATVFQAGALTMLDEEARQAMLESGEPTADALDAMRELLDAQSRCFNNIPGNPHVHINTLRPTDAEKDAWVFNPVQSMGLRDPFDGRVLLASC